MLAKPGPYLLKQSFGVLTDAVVHQYARGNIFVKSPPTELASLTVKE